MDCIYLAAGTGARMKEVIPKQFLTILGKPIIVCALEMLESSPLVDTVYITYHPEYKKLYENVLRNYNIANCQLVSGGSTRQESVANALEKVGTDRVLVHEAARPFITVDFIEYLTTFDDDAVVPTIPISFTVSEGQEYMERELVRSHLHNVQLPQIFSTDVLRSSHAKALKEGYTATEDGILVFRAGKKVRFVEGLENNIKITTPLDIIIAEHMFRGISL